MKTVHEILVEARELISNPSNWTKDVFAKNLRGRSCAPSDPEACSWCLEGAIIRVSKHPFIEGPFEYLRNYLENFSVAAFNDSHEHYEVIEMLDGAIEKAKNDGV